MLRCQDLSAEDSGGKDNKEPEFNDFVLKLTIGSKEKGKERSVAI
jgi:hypothetical protein